MKVIDLHCDTLSELRYAQNRGEPLYFEENDLMIDLKKLQRGDYLLQCFACFVNLSRDPDPLKACLEMVDIFYSLLEACPQLTQVKSPKDLRALPSSGRIGAMLTIEEGGVCLDDERILRSLYRLGVRMMTLTWNHENGLASPNLVPDSIENIWPCSPVTDRGLKEKGRAFVAEMERLHMLVDVSHLSDRGIWDLLECSTRPFVASHSNARALCAHTRNLTDEMIRQMGERGCLIGLNYCPCFLNHEAGKRSRIQDMARHARYLMNLGGEEILALGSDFDGITGDLEIGSAADLPLLAEGLIREGLTPRQVEKIFSGNALRFFEENL